MVSITREVGTWGWRHDENPYDFILFNMSSSKTPGSLHSPESPGHMSRDPFGIVWLPECCLHSKKFLNQHAFIPPALDCTCEDKGYSHSSATHSPLTHAHSRVMLWSENWDQIWRFNKCTQFRNILTIFSNLIKSGIAPDCDHYLYFNTTNILFYKHL